MFTSDIKMGGKCDLRDVGGVAGLCISEVDDLLGFSCTVVCSVYNEWCKEKEKKNPVNVWSMGRITLLMREVRGEGPDWFKLTVTVTKVTTLYTSMLSRTASHFKP